MHSQPTPGRPPALANPLLAETLIGLGEVARRFPTTNGRPLHIATVNRWRCPGVGGSRLEAVRVGGRWMTSLEALDRFVTATNAAREQDRPAAGPRNRRQAAVARHLDEEGL